MIKDYLCSGMTIDYYVSGSGSKDIALDSLKKIVRRPIIISVWSKSTAPTTLKWFEISLKIYMLHSDVKIQYWLIISRRMQTKIGWRPCISVKDFQNESKCSVGGFCAGEQISLCHQVKSKKQNFRLSCNIFSLRSIWCSPTVSSISMQF